jgi:hypothetical protein
LVRAETLNVLKAALAITVITAAYLFRPSFGAQSPTRQTPMGLLPYQKLIRDASPAEQQPRELQEGCSRWNASARQPAPGRT